jgi:hypothetical protein
MCVYDVACGVTTDKESVTYLKSTNYTEPWKNVLYSPGKKLRRDQFNTLIYTLCIGQNREGLRGSDSEHVGQTGGVSNFLGKGWGTIFCY